MSVIDARERFASRVNKKPASKPDKVELENELANLLLKFITKNQDGLKQIGKKAKRLDNPLIVNMQLTDKTILSVILYKDK